MIIYCLYLPAFDDFANSDVHLGEIFKSWEGSISLSGSGGGGGFLEIIRKGKEGSKYLGLGFRLGFHWSEGKSS